MDHQISSEVVPILYSQRLRFKNGYTLQEFLIQSCDKLSLLKAVELRTMNVPNSIDLGSDGTPKTAYRVWDINYRPLGQDLDLLFAMLARATNLEEFIILTLGISQEDEDYFEDRWESLSYMWDSNRPFVDCEERFLLTGQELARLILPAACVWFEAMHIQGRDWKKILTLTKKNTVGVDWFPAVYDHRFFFFLESGRFDDRSQPSLQRRCGLPFTSSLDLGQGHGTQGCAMVEVQVACDGYDSCDASLPLLSA